MRVLLTNNRLAERSGTELYVRDIALALLALGHEPIAYSRHLGEVAEELRRATVPVIDDLEALRRPPDLIHAQHHLESMTALLRFAKTPAIYLCHGWLPAEEAPPRHPRIRRYVAVDELVRQRLLDECGLEPSRVQVHLNFVDLNRFARRKPLPRKPQRALVFSNQVSEANYLPLLEQACVDAGLHLDVVGRGAGRAASAPEEILAGYDIVFAKGRSALEAASVGCAVVLCDLSGLGPMVTSDQLPRLRSYNFGVRLLRQPITVESVRQQLERYDAEDASQVTTQMRADIGLDKAVDRLVDLYQEVLAEFSPEIHSSEEDSVAAARYLRWGPLSAGDFFNIERVRYLVELERASDWARDLSRRLSQADQQRILLEERCQGAEAEFATLESALEQAQGQVRWHQQEADRWQGLADERQSLTHEQQSQIEEWRRQAESWQRQAGEWKHQADERHGQVTHWQERSLEGEKRVLEGEKRVLEGEERALENEQRALENEKRALENEQRAAGWQSQADDWQQKAVAGELEKKLLSEDVEGLAKEADRLSQENACLDNELSVIKRSAAWRWRQRLMSFSGLQRIYRMLFGSRSED